MSIFNFFFFFFFRAQQADSPTTHLPLSSSDFNAIRAIFEAIEDFSILADVLKLVSSSHDSVVLASIAYTLDYHFLKFNAIGALNGLFETVAVQIRTLKRQPEKYLLLSLVQLAERIPTARELTQQLRHDLIQSDGKSAAIACSPVSDHVAEAHQVTFVDSGFNEIEKVLNTGNTIDKQTMVRIFDAIKYRMKEAWFGSNEQIRNCS